MNLETSSRNLHAALGDGASFLISRNVVAGLNDTLTKNENVYDATAALDNKSPIKLDI